MADPFIGQIQGFGFNFAPRGWGNCNGALQPIDQNQALFSLLGTMYGGDGRTTYGLPDLRGRVALNFGRGPGLPDYKQGVKGGTTTNTMTTAQMPSHNHQIGTHNHKLRATIATANTFVPGSAKLLGQSIPTTEIYATPGTLVTLDDTAPNQAISEAVGAASSNTGGGNVVNNVPPYQVIEMCIALQGIYPSRN